MATIGNESPIKQKGNTLESVAFETTWVAKFDHAAAVVDGDDVSSPLVVELVAGSVFGFSDEVTSSEEFLLLAGEVDFPA